MLLLPSDLRETRDPTDSGGGGVSSLAFRFADFRLEGGLLQLNLSLLQTAQGRSPLHCNLR